MRFWFRPPRSSTRFVPVWQRNFMVWKKLAIPSMLGNLADPMLYMLGLGFGLGTLLPEVEGLPYLTFLAGGTVAYATMNSASFEVLYSGFSRMHVQKTWEAILNTPLTLDDVLLGEWLWATSKATLSGLAILAIVWVLGLERDFALSLGLVPVIVLTGLCFAGMGLVMTAVSPSYDFFLYYFTLVITPHGAAVRRVLPGRTAAVAARADFGLPAPDPCHRLGKTLAQGRASRRNRPSCYGAPRLWRRGLLAGPGSRAAAAARLIPRVREPSVTARFFR